MAAEAALQGMGVALIPRLLVEDELRRGALIQVARHEYLSDRNYYLIYPEHNADHAALGVFRVWLEEQAREYREPLGLG